MSNKWRTPRQRVAIGVPDPGLVYGAFAYDLATLTMTTRAERPNIDLGIFRSEGTFLPQQRETLVDVALHNECTHLLFLDSDMRFPPYTLLRLLGAKRAVIGANYCTRRKPFRPTAVKEIGATLLGPGGTGVERVAAIGFGVALIDLAVVRRVPRPRFLIGYGILPPPASPTEYVSDDVYFCTRLAELGVEVWVDHDLSREVEHLGTRSYKLTDVAMPDAVGSP